MKLAVYVAVLAAFMVVVAGACNRQETGINKTTAAGSATPTAAVTVASHSPSPENAYKLDDKTRQALLDALADERRAEASYKAAIAKFGDVRPFSNIVNAERRHESFLLPLFSKYGVPVPENEIARANIDVPTTLAEACRLGVEGERANIAMYDRFLEFAKEEDIREVFTYLRDASKDNHLPAFERCASRRG